MAQFSESLGFYLPDSFSSDVELLSYLFEGARIPVRQSESQVENLLFSLSQRSEDILKAVLQ